MYRSFDAFEYVEHLRRHWRTLAAACSAALILALGISLLLPKRYTATATIVIESPGGNDARLSTAVSPIYLESLKTYERFAESDSLFAGSVDRFHLVDVERPSSIEALKRRVLKVTKPKDTKILEISATLRDPKLAQQLAQYIAEQTVSANRKASLASDQELVDQAQTQVSESQRRLEELQQQWNKLAVNQPVEALQSEIDSAVELESKVQEQLVQAQSQAAEYEQQSASDQQFAREQLQGSRAKAALLEKRYQLLQREIADKSGLLATHTGQRTALQSELKATQTASEAAAARLREYRATAGSHAEQLRIIDPGIVPEQPSSPNVFLNVGAAVFLAFVGTMVYLSFAFVYRRRPMELDAPIKRGMRA